MSADPALVRLAPLVMESPRAPSSEAVVRAVERAYGFAVTSCAPLDLGHDAASWSWRVETGSDAWFVKVRVGTEAPRGALEPAYLGRRGVPGIVATRVNVTTSRAIPTPTSTGRTR